MDSLEGGFLAELVDSLEGGFLAELVEGSSFAAGVGG